MKILITGAKGFSAFYLHKLISQDLDTKIVLTDLDDCDLSNYHDVEKLLNLIKPDQIYHLAGSFTNNYLKDYQANVISTKNILDSLLTLRLTTRILLVGSAAEYGTPAANPVKEDSPLNPTSIYGLTKTFQTLLMKLYCSVYGLDVVMARTFNLMGKGISNTLFIGNLYEQIEQFRKGDIPKIVLGNLSAERDYIDISDAVIDYQTIMKSGETGSIYNVGSGKPVRIHELLDKILKENGLTKDNVEERIAYKSNVMQVYADIQKLNNIKNK